MKSFLALLLFVHVCTAQEAYFFQADRGAERAVVEGDTLVIKRPIKKEPPPEVNSIRAYKQGFGGEREYQIQIDLAGRAKKGWRPNLKLGEDVLIEEVFVVHLEGEDPRDLIQIESGDKEKVVKWLAHLSKLLRVPKDKIRIDFEKASWAKPEGTDTGQTLHKKAG